MQEMLKKAGINQDKPIISYCTQAILQVVYGLSKGLYLITS
jgi:3-mercaptopyruvate sulfurtransferase SseA